MCLLVRISRLRQGLDLLGATMQAGRWECIILTAMWLHHNNGTPRRHLRFGGVLFTINRDVQGDVTNASKVTEGEPK